MSEVIVACEKESIQTIESIYNSIKCLFLVKDSSITSQDDVDSYIISVYNFLVS